MLHLIPIVLAGGGLPAPPDSPLAATEAARAGGPALVEAAAGRPMSADRPDVTESPITVEPGRLQLEMSFFDLGMDRGGGSGERTRTLAVAPFNLKIGVLDSTDVQVVVSPWVRQRVEDRASGAVESEQGFGDLTIRVKHNVWGNDGGATALAVMPYVTLPTATGGLGAGGVEGGVIVPLAIALPWEWELGLMAEVDLVRGEDGRATEFLHTAALGREIVENVRGFVEYAGVASTRGAYRASVNAGAVIVLGPDIALDAGVRMGISDGAEDFGVFAGITLRY